MSRMMEPSGSFRTRSLVTTPLFEDGSFDGLKIFYTEFCFSCIDPLAKRVKLPALRLAPATGKRWMGECPQPGRPRRKRLRD